MAHQRVNDPSSHRLAKTEGSDWFCSAGCLHYHTGRLQTVQHANLKANTKIGLFTIIPLLYKSL